MITFTDKKGNIVLPLYKIDNVASWMIFRLGVHVFVICICLTTYHHNIILFIYFVTLKALLHKQVIGLTIIVI